MEDTMVFQSHRESTGVTKEEALLYVREGIKSKSIPVSFNSNTLEYLLVEITLRKKKWLLVCCYNPHRSFSEDFLAALSKEIDPLFQDMKTS